MEEQASTQHTFICYYTRISMGCLPQSTCLGSLSLTQSPNSLVLREGLEIQDNHLCRGASASVFPADVLLAAGVPTVSGSFPTPMRIPIIGAKDKGKEKMIETEVPKKRKLQEQINAQVAREMEEEFARENQRLSEQLARDSEIARLHAEEELKIMIEGLDRSNEVIEKHLSEYEQAKTNLSVGEKIELIRELEKREFYMSVLRSHAGWKTKHFKRMTLEQIKEKFIPVWKQFEDFVPMSLKEESKRVKRQGLKIDHGSSKRMKISEGASEEELKGMMQLVPLEEVCIEALQVKHPIIDWEIHSEGKREYWKILRLGGHTAVYQFFVDMLKQFDREDLHQLWTLVKETFSTKQATRDKEKELWKFRIQQYLQNEHYALWEVIEFCDSYKAPPEETGKSPASESSAKKKGRTVAITTEDMQKRRNDAKVRTTLLLALPDEHQLRFSKYETAKELWEAILKTFGGNEATKKTNKNQLKMQYGNFKAEGSETLEDDRDTMSLDDVYNHLKVYEPEVQKKLESNSQNLAFISSSNTSSGKAASLSHDTVCAYIATQSNGSQIKYKDITQIDEDDIEEMDIKWNMALLSMRADRFWKKTGKKITIQGSDVAGFDKSKVECFNCHKMGNFARECREPRSQDRGKRESYKQENHALVADDEVPTEFALTAKSSSSLHEFVDDTVTDYSRPTPSIDASKCNKSELQSSNFFSFEHGESSDSIMSKPMIKFVKEVDCPRVIKTNNTENARKSTVKYAEMYRNISKGPKVRGSQQNWNNLKSQQLGKDFLMQTKHVLNVGNSQNKIDDKGYWDSENKLIEKGASPNWLFNIDILTNSMNYVPVVVAGTSSTNILVPPAEQVEHAVSLTVESEIPTDSLHVPTICLDILPESSSGPRLITKGDFSQKEIPSLGNALTLSNRFKDTFGVEADLSNIETSIPVSPTPTFRIHKDHPKSQIIGPVDTHVQTRHKFKEMEEQSFIATIHQKTNPKHLQFCLFSCFLSQEEPKKIFDALKDPSWPLGFQNPKFPDRVYKVEKAVYGLHQAPRAWSANTPMDKENPWGKDGPGKDVELHLYRSMIGSLMYLTASRPNIMVAVCACARHQTIVATSISEAEYVTAASGYGQVLWIQNQMLDYGLSKSREDLYEEITSYVLMLVGLLMIIEVKLAFCDYHNMVAILEKTEQNIDFHQIVDFLEASHIRIETTNQETKILATVDGKPQTISESSHRRHLKLNDEEGISSLPDTELFGNLSLMGPNQSNTATAVVCLATNKGESSANPTEPHHTPSPQEHHSPQHDSPPPSHQTIISEPHPQAPTETLTHRKYTKRAIRIAQSKALTPTADEHASFSRDDRQREASLTVSSLDAGQDRENIAKTSALPHESSSRVPSLGVDEGSMQQRIHELMELCTSLQSSMEAANILSSGGAAANVSPADVLPAAGVPTVSGSFPTVSEIFTTASVEQIDARVAREMEEEFVRENKRLSKQLARDSDISRLYAEEELKIMIEGLDGSNEVIVKHLSEYEQAETDLSVGEKIELIRELEQREFYMSVPRSHAGWKTKHFRGMTLEQIKEKFIPVWKQFEDFVPMSSKKESKRVKRQGLKIDQGSSKRMKTSWCI
nr:hypothetical protein [Tanacetum cinerariifolium]